MAKKKTENIKAAPVLRAQSGGEQPTPETPVITKSYSVRDDWKDKDIVNYVAFKSVDGEVQDLTVNGEPAGGGGGGSDVTYAPFSITDSSGSSSAIVNGLVCNSRNNEYYGQLFVNDLENFDNIVLCGGSAVLWSTDRPASVSGSVTVQPVPNSPTVLLIVTGPGSLTY
jgi:hypothetical protein